ncbi:MAG TPA: tryptophan synthase subunit beta [Bacteroidetes bacterium]|nr:tryptophan synthase subunit beta [Bacteroidota bacterium]
MKIPENIKGLCALKPDFVGMIFYAKSPRNVGKTLAGKLGTWPKESKKVGVFVNEKLEEIVEKVREFQLDYVQLHGDESPGFCAAVEGFVPVIKAFRVNENFDFEQTKGYEAACEMFVFDAAGKNYGGNGKQFAWNQLKSYQGKTPFLLSGGIGIADAAEIRGLQHPSLIGVDINSGFETAPGHKDLGQVKQFMEDLHSQYAVSDQGFYGRFGGAYIPEMLHPNVEELRKTYLKMIGSADFQAEYVALLKDYAGRPTPLFEAERLSAKYGARIFLKREDLLHTGAHKLNNTIGQVLLAERLGKKRIIAETGAGQHGVATATVCALKGLQCIVYMGAHDMERQAPNVARMRMLGAEVRPATCGSKTLKDATNEAIRDWISNPVDTHYIIGSVVGPHPYPDLVARFQSVISAETKRQLAEKNGRENPDMVIACVGGGSNAAGAFYHYLDSPEVKLIAAEAAGKGVDSGMSAATSFLGKIGILHGSRTLLMQTTDGQVVEPYSISAGLDYPGIGPLHAHLIDSGRARALAITDQEALEAAFELARLEGIIPALESAHALACLGKLDLKSDQTIILNLSGRGDKDLETFMRVLPEFTDFKPE